MIRASVWGALPLLVLTAGGCGGKTFGADDAAAGTSGAGTGGSGGSGTGGSGGGTGGKATGGSSGKGSGGDAGAAAVGGMMSTGGSPMGGQSGAGTGGDAGAAIAGSGGASGAGAGGDAGGSMAGSGGAVAGMGGIGIAGAAGLAGAAGAPSAAECTTAEDCVRFTDCCSCSAEPKNTARPMCDLACIEDACFALGIARDEVTCAFGRCVFDRSCDGNESTCPALPPNCAAGTVPSVLDGCWGPCLPATECRSVATCDACVTAGAACVMHELQVPSVGCVEPGTCEKGNLCECLDACSGFQCTETETGVGCFCPAC